MPSDSPLDNLARIGQLKREPPDREEPAGLIRSGRVRLDNAANQTLSIESRFDLAYNAAHALSLAALRWHGYRSENRYQVFQCLQHTLALPAEQWRVLDQAHRKRNLAEQEGGIFGVEVTTRPDHLGSGSVPRLRISRYLLYA